ncbi:hypothetical protein [Streptomyces griseorubiginosus]|uniref:hypothetical protein n=1 Tax=Streptomyces griseorubiginosus TaxID=67304 RepID=UPI003454C9CC
MTSYVFKLSFSQIRCSGCNIDRIRGVACPDCGLRPQPWEIDTAGLARRQVTADAQKMLAQPVTALPTGPLGAPETLHANLFTRLTTWMPHFFQAATAAAANATEQGAADLKASVTEFIELRAMVHHTDAKRPLKVLVTVLRQLVDELTSMIDAYLAALLAAIPLKAQEHGAAAQRHLDRVTALIEQSNTVAAAADLLAAERDVARVQTILLTQALRTYGVPDLLALDSAARDGLHAITSSRGVDGSGLTFAIGRVLAQSIFDLERFQDVLRRAYAVFQSNPAVLRSLAQTPSFESDFKRALCELFDGSLEAVHTVDHAVHSRQAGRALLGIAASQVEGPGQVIACALLLACGRKSAPYTTLRHKNATELVTAVQQENALHGLLDGLDKDLRTGRAHALVHYEDDGAVIERKSGTRTVTWRDVIDGVFQGYESIYACQLALWQALGELGFSSFAVDDLWQALGLRADQMVTIMLETSSCQDIVITPGRKHWHVEARVQSAHTLSLLIALIRPYLPEQLDELTFTAHQGDQIHTLAGPLALWRAYTATPQDSEARSIAYLRAQRSWTYDDAPVLSADVIRRWVARQAEETMEQTPAAAITRLRSFRDLAASTADDDLVWALNGLIRYKRLGKASKAAAELSQLQSWCHVPVEFPDGH